MREKNSSTYSTARGRISKAGTTVKLQLLKLSFDQYHIHTSSNIALAILRDIKSTPVRIRRTVAYARRVRNLLTILNNYNRATYEAKGKYPYSKALVRLLVRYVQLEYDVLYYPENYSVKYEKEVEVKVHFLLHLLLDGVVRKFRQENVQHYDSTATECVLRIFNQVNGEYKVKGRFIWSAINKLAKKLGLLETISEIRQNGVLLSQNHPTFTKLSCDNIEDISDCDSEYEIPLSPARSCPSPIENLKVEYPVKREPPDLDSGQGIEHLSIHNGFGSGIGEDDDSDADSVISDGKLQRLLDVKCEIQDYSSDSDDCVLDYSSDSDDCVLDLKSERERSNSVQIIGDNYDSKCNLTDVAIQSTNEFAKREQRLNKNGDRGENSNNNSSVNNKRDDLIIGDSHSNNSNNHNNHNNKNSNGDISKAPSNAGNSSQVIELDDDDDEDDLIVVTKSTKTIKNSPQKAKSPVIVLLDSDDENDCVIVNDEQKIPKCDDKVKHKKIRSFSDNQVNEISSTTGSNISSKFSPFTERPACANGNNTSNNYRRMNRSGSSEVHALEDLTPEVSANHENTPNVIEDVAKIKEEDVKDPKDDASTSRSGQTPPPSEEPGIKDVAALTESTTVSEDQTLTDTTNKERKFRTSNEIRYRRPIYDQTLTDTTNKERKFRASNEIRYRRPIYDDVMQSRSYDSNLSILNKDRRSPTNYTNGYRFATSSIGRNLDQIRTRPFVSDTKVIMHRNNVTSLRRDIREDVSLGSGEDSPELRLDELSRRDFDQIWSGAVSSKIAQSGSFEAENLKEKTYDKHKEIADEILFGLNSPKSNQTESAAQVLDLRGQSLDKTPKMPSETTLLNYFSNTTATDLTNVEPPLHVKQRQRYFEGKLEQNLSKDLEENVLEKVQDLSLPPVEESEAIINQPRGEMVPTLEGSDSLEDSQSLDQSDAKTNEQL
ncbi:hypothetical protein QE152_g15487 [Popillia japonica]|uniref:Uncharacterized protein n=1 Tax=Popillia japonica TaxID=7064 RepID=A0AAW1L834_POPJA